MRDARPIANLNVRATDKDPTRYERPSARVSKEYDEPVVSIAD